MARIPDHEIERLKLQVSIVRLVESAGVVLKPHGKERIGRCVFHEDRSPSLVISPKSNLWHCLGACQAGGSVIDWVMRFEGVDFRRAVELLRQEIGEAPGLEEPACGRAESSDVAPSAPSLAAAVDPASDVPARPRPAPPLPALASASDQALLRSVVEYYHATLLASPEALAYADGRGITMEALTHFQLGYGNRTLGTQLPLKAVKAGAEVRGALQRVGLLRESGHEHFNGSLVVPVIAPDGEIAEMYGRKVTPNLRPGTPLHLYLPGPHRGVFNESGLIGHEEAIWCEALIDALTFWCAGYRNASSSYGAGGFTDEMLATLLRIGTKRVLIAYDANDAGNRGAEALAERLLAAGIECYRCRFPKGMDANEYALAVKPAIKSLGVVIRQAEWMGKAATDVQRPTSRSMLEVLPGDVGDVPQRAAALMVERGEAASAADEAKAAEQAPLYENAADAVAQSAADVPFLAAAPAVAAPVAIAAKKEICAESPAPTPAPAAARVAPSVPLLPVTIDASGMLTLMLGDREYRVRGIEKNLGYEQLNVWLRASRGDYLHLDTTNLANAARRASWVKAASVELGLAEDVARADLAKLLRAVEDRQAALIREQLQPKAAVVAEPSPEQHAAALALLKDPQLIERIVADVEAIGVVGEASNALVAYLACVSRKLDKPLAILIQSTSAAGKSTLMDAVLSLMPEAERVQYSAMTGQSLFYLGENDLKHKILAIAEEEGVRQAAYALKLLQSQGVLTIASTGKDPITGQLVTQPYRVEGPVMLFLTTTAIDIDEELLNRCVVLTIDESREQTAAIQARQRSARTLEGLLTKARGDEVLATHRAAQALLKPLAVANPFAEQLTFASDCVRLRRDQQKYLTLIEAIALLHQHQRPVRATAWKGKPIEYIEVTAADIALANRLAHEALGRSLDELPPQTRRMLAQLSAYVDERARTQGIERSSVRFTRRELRAHIGASEKQTRVHLDRLVELEYLLTHAGRSGQRFRYELLFDGDVGSDEPQAIGLIDIERLSTAADAGTTAKLVASSSQLVADNLKLVGRSWPASGPLVGTSSAPETALPARPGALLPASVAVVAESTALTEPPPSRLNGASYPNLARS
jgi:DNA primase/energy-coupling factor transporter ATP-binding protein EcfA2